MRSWSDLIIWKKSHQFTLDVYKITANFPESEKYGIISQIRRAAYSVPSNIVEGHSRKTDKEFLNFLHIARGSLEEVKYFLLLSKDLNYLASEVYEKLISLASEVSYLLQKFIGAIQ